MKKLAAVVAAVGLIGLLSGCSAGKDDTASSKSSSAKTVQHVVQEHLNGYTDGDVDIYVDFMGNVIYKTSKESSVVPFNQLADEQIKMLQSQGVKFPQQLLNERFKSK